ncbi:MAG: YitT family protein [Chloroflexota bacterium]
MLRQNGPQFTLVLFGSVIAAMGYALFQVPFDLAAGGVSGIGIIISHFTDWSAGLLYLILNIPMMVLGFYYLGRWSFVALTLLSVFCFSVATDLILAYIPRYVAQFPLTDDVFLSAVYAGIVAGIGAGLVFRAGATMAGTGVLGRILQLKTGIPLSQVYLHTDGVIVLAAGFIFGWEIALYAMLTLLLSGMASDYALEGASRARTATIITNYAETVIPALTQQLNRGVSHWQAVGGYSGTPRTVILCTVYRPQVTELKRIINEVDPEAFVSIGVTQDVFGQGFHIAK